MKIRPIIVLLLFLFLYLLLPTRNSVNDAWSYAADIKWGNELFDPHHLLYTATGYGLYTVLSSFINVEALSMMKVLNAFFAFLSLLMLNRLLILQQVKPSQRNSLLLFAGSSFAVMRYATDNETYIVPIFFSLAGSYFIFRFLLITKESKFILLASLCGVVASLYHQIHFFWWLALAFTFFFLPEGRWKFLFLYMVTGLLAPLTYAIIVWAYLHKDPTINGVLEFASGYFSRGGTVTIGLPNFLFTFVNLFRTFLQLHGNIYVMWTKHVLFILPTVLLTLGLVYIIWKQRPSFTFQIKHKPLVVIHSVALVLQIGFAFLSAGNAEFMVMVPFLLVIIGGCMEWKSLAALQTLSICMLIWNLSYGLLPNYFFKYSPNTQLREYVLNHPGELFILSEANQVRNECYYETGKIPENIYPCPSEYMLKNKTGEQWLDTIQTVRKEGQSILTDCIGNAEVLSRASIVKGEYDKEYLKKYTYTPMDSFPTFSGKKLLYKLENF